MSQTVWTSKKIMLISFVAAGTTVIAGILHLIMAPQTISNNLGQGILFLVGGMLQVFWAIPVIKRWGRIWQVIGIAGTAVFVILYFSSRFHLLPEGNILGGLSSGNITGGELPRGNITGGEFPRGIRQGGMGFRLGGSALVIEVCQIAFIGLYAVLTKLYSKSGPKKIEKKSDDI